MESSTPPMTPETEHSKRRFGLFRRHPHGGGAGDDVADLPRAGTPPPTHDDGTTTVVAVDSGSPDDAAGVKKATGSKMKQKQAARKEKKERQEQRKDMKKNPQFDFIETNEPAQFKKKDIKAKKREDKGLFYFTSENKHLRGHMPITRQMVRNVKHAVKPPVVDAVRTNNKMSLSASELPTLPTNAKGLTKVDLEDFLLRHPMHRLLGTTWSYMHVRSSASLLAAAAADPASSTASQAPAPAAQPPATAPALAVNNANIKAARRSSRTRDTMLVLTGGGMRPEVFFEMFEALAEDYDVVAPMLPNELATFEDYVAGLELLRAHLRLRVFHVMGVALGGMVALHYAALHPSHVLSLTLSHTSPPNAEFGRLCAKFGEKLSETNKLKLAERKLQDERPPSALQRALVGYRVHSKDLARDVPTMLAEPGVLVLWKRMVQKFALQPQGIQTKLEAMAKYHSDVTYTAATFAALAGPVLLMDTERRDAFGVKSFEDLKLLFPHAQVDYREGCGHLSVLVKGQDVAHTVLRALQQVAALPARVTDDGSAPTMDL